MISLRSQELAEPRSCADPQRHSTAPGERRIDDGVHLLQQHVGSVGLSCSDGHLDRIAQRQYLPPLVRFVCVDILVTLPVRSETSANSAFMVSLAARGAEDDHLL